MKRLRVPLAHATFTRWISKFGIPEVIMTHYEEDFHNALKHDLTAYTEEDPIKLATTYDSIQKFIRQAQLS